MSSTFCWHGEFVHAQNVDAKLSFLCVLQCVQCNFLVDISDFVYGWSFWQLAQTWLVCKDLKAQFVRVPTRQMRELKSRTANDLCDVNLNPMVLVDCVLFLIFKTNIKYVNLLPEFSAKTCWLLRIRNTC